MDNLKKFAFAAPGARAVGRMEIGKDVSIWYNAVIRADGATYVIGDETNIQDGCILHGETPVILGKRVSLGHGAIIHGATIGDNVLVGMGSIIMDGARVGDNSLVAAGALITKGREFPPNSLIMGSPAKLVRQLTAQELESVSYNADLYLALSKKHREELWDMPTEELIEEIRKARRSKFHYGSHFGN